MGRFLIDAAGYDYPRTPIGMDVILPGTRAIEFNVERDVHTVIQTHLHNLNRIFMDQAKSFRFKSKVAASTAANNNDTKTPQFIGLPDNVLDSEVLSFIEDKTSNDLPVRHCVTGQLFDLLTIYKEDVIHNQTGSSRELDGRRDVCHLMNQVYGYMALNNLTYGCVTCYDVTYFLWRPIRGTLHITPPVHNQSIAPTLMQALYYFVIIVLT